MSITIQRLTPDHANEYRRLMLDAYARHPDAFTSSHAERVDLPLSWWQSRLDATPDAMTMVFGAIAQAELAGVVGLSFEGRERVRHKATLFGTIVADAYRAQGLGRRLVEFALARAVERTGVSLVQLTVTKGNPMAESLYEKCGFVSFGVEPEAVAVNGGFVAKVHLWRRVERVV